MTKRQTGARHLLAVAFATVAAVFAVHAAEVSSGQAKTAVANWLQLGSRRLDAQFGSRDVENVKTVRSKSGRAVYHAVNLKGGGFVVTSGDTRLPPVIAFSDKGNFTEDETSSFHALLDRTLSRAVDKFTRADRQVASPSGVARKGGDLYANAAAEWAELLSADDGRQVRADNSGKTSLSDVRVDKLLATEWGQGGISIWNWNSGLNDWEETYYPSFDYYTPDGYPCGCVATAGAQIMRYWKQPSGSIAQFSNTCVVNGTPVAKSSIAGAFDWDAMYLKWDGENNEPVPSEKAREAVGKLTYNIAVAVGMEWGDWYGSASPTDLIAALKEKFGYVSGTFVWHDLAAFDKESAFTPDDFAARMRDFYCALYASLDAKMPVLLSIDGDFGGHAVIADGYGYTAGKRYTHLNFGWYGGDDAWYYLPDETLVVKEGRETYSAFDGVGFNIHPTETGDVISGRVLDGNGYAVAGATVEIYDSTDSLSATVTSDAKGIYAFRIKTTGTYTVKASHTATKETPSKSVTKEYMSQDGSFSDKRVEPWAGWSGNEWGVDLRFPVAIPSAPEPEKPEPEKPEPDPGTPEPEKPDPGTDGTFTVTFDPNGGSVSQSAVKVTAGNAIGDALPVPVRIGYEFIGWKIDTYNWVEKDTVVSANISCQAVWWPYLYTVTLDTCGGYSDCPSIEVYYDDVYATLPVPTKGDAVFVGWFTAKDGGVQIKETDTVRLTANTTFYAHWKSGSAPVIPEPVTPGPGTVDPVIPEPVTPSPGTVDPDTTVCYEVLNANDIKAPYSAPKAVTLRGAVYDGCDVVGIVELKLGKVNVKKGTSKVSGSFVGLDGKKVTLKAVTVRGIDGNAPVIATFDVKGYAPMSLKIGGGQFAGAIGTNWHVQSAVVGGNWNGAKATVKVSVNDVAAFPGDVQEDLLPLSEVANVANGKWVFAKAASVKWAKPKANAAQPEIYDEASGKGLVVDVAGGKTNRSGLKLTYTAKKGTFKGSFKLYALEGAGKATKLKKYTVNVTGLVVDNVGYGTAVCKKPVARWNVVVK